MIIVTVDQLARGMSAKPEAADLWCESLNITARLFEINANSKRLASWLAQLAHESGALEHAREIWGPTRAQRRYEGRRDLGNTVRGDGERFKGYGLIQITGRANARRATRHLAPLIPNCPDFEVDPKLMAIPPWGALVAGAFWDWNNLSALGDQGATVRITFIVNGGANGLLDRRRHYARLLKVLNER